MADSGLRPGRLLGRRLLMTVVAGLALTGCADIPDRGPVISGRPAGDDARVSPYLIFPRRPAPDAKPEQIVEGFLAAAAGFSEDHSVARSFLTVQRRTSWRPDEGVLLYDGEQSEPHPQIVPVRGKGAGEATEAARVDVVVPALASVDAEGWYSPRADGHRQRLTFGLERVTGQWRIADLADGLVMTRDDFDLTFRAFPIYFPDPSGSFMVPDVHWFPLTSATPAALVSALLAGPATWLEGAVTTGAPPGTRLAVPAVPVLDELATVDLTTEARQATPRQRQLLTGQLDQTLTAMSSITQVRITVQRGAFDVGSGAGAAEEPGQDADQPRMQADPRVDDSLIALDPAGRPAQLSTGKLIPLRGAEPVASRQNAAVAMTSDGSAVAVLDSSRRQVHHLLPGSKAGSQVLIRGTGLTRPSFDPLGWVWSAPAAGAGVLAARPEPGQVTVAAPWLRQYRVRSLRISRDGARAVIAAVRDGRGHLLVSGVQRRSDGRPTTLTSPTDLLPDLVSALDAGWVDEDEVVVLGRSRGGAEDAPSAGSTARQVWVVRVGGPAEQVPPLAKPADSITAGNGGAALVVGTPTGQLYTRAGAGWIPLTRGRAPAFPG